VASSPSPPRFAFDLKAGEELIAEETPEGILLRPSVSVPIELYTDDRIAEFASYEEELAKLYPPPETA